MPRGNALYRSACAAEVVAKFDIPADADELLLPVSINGKQWRFSLDTGSSHTVCDSSIAKHLGKPIGVASARTANGVSRTAVFRPVGLTIGRIPFREGKPVISADLSMIRRATGTDVRGLVGMDFLVDHVIRIDFDRRELLFLRSADGVQGEAVPMTFTAQMEPTVSAAFDGVKMLEFSVDTGYAGLTSGAIKSGEFHDLLRRGILTSTGAGAIATPTGASTTQSAQIASFRFASFTTKELIFDELTDMNVLGLSYWSRFIVTFDFPNAKLYVSPSRRFSIPDLPDLSGLHLLRINGVCTVHSVDANSAADEAGIKPGDTINRIEDCDASKTPMQRLRKMLCASGRVVILSMKRGASAERVTLRLSGRRTPSEQLKGHANGATKREK